MRRMILVALGMGLLGAAVGCNCVHGVCDCDRQPPSVLHAEPALAPGVAAPSVVAPSVVAPPPLHAEPIPVAPMPVGK